jgi:hypothetical protein
MKSTRRHELQHNTLQDELARAGGWLKRHINAISWGLLAVAVAIVLVVWLTGRKAKVAEDIHERYSELQRQPAGGEQFAEVFQGFQDLAVQAGDADKKHIAAGCWVQAGNLGLDRLIMTGDLTAAQRADLVKQTRRCYEAALAEYGDQALWAGKARLGLGRLSESVDPPDLAAAREHYTKVAENEDLAHTPLQWAAQGALQRLEADREPVRLAVAMPPEPGEETPGSDEPDGASDEPAGPADEPDDGTPAPDEAAGDEPAAEGSDEQGEAPTDGSGAAPEEPAAEPSGEPLAEPANGPEPAADVAPAEEETDAAPQTPVGGADAG